MKKIVQTFLLCCAWTHGFIQAEIRALMEDASVCNYYKKSGVYLAAVIRDPQTTERKHVNAKGQLLRDFKIKDLQVQLRACYGEGFFLVQTLGWYLTIETDVDRSLLEHYHRHEPKIIFYYVPLRVIISHT